MSKYAQYLNPARIPQSQQADERQVKNQAGGYVYALSAIDMVRRFLVLGAEGATYYATERKMVLDNAQTVLQVLRTDGPAVVRLAEEISVAGRAPKNDAAIFVLALAIKHGDDGTRALAYPAVLKVCRIGTHLFTLLQYLKDLGKGESRGLRSILKQWYLDRDPAALAFQAVKYQQRNGWSHRDVLRLAHPRSTDAERNAVLNWVVKGWSEVGEQPPTEASLRTIWAMESAKRAGREADVIRLIKEHRLPFEAVPSEWLKSPAVWTALIPHLGYTALIRNLARMTANGTLVPLGAATSLVVQRLRDAAVLRQSRVHPVQVLSALKTYEQGRGERGSLTWKPVGPIVDALNDAFYLAFGNVESTGKRYLLALDVSGSMASGTIAGVPGLTPRIASAAMAMVTAAVEPQHQIVGFSAPSSGNFGGQWGGGDPGLTPIAISPRQRLTDVIKTIEKIPMGGTDCSLPMRYALKHGVQADVFCVYTDNETWAGPIHPMEALRQYRAATGIAARLIVVGMTATTFTIADPQDAGALDVVGFDSATPALMTQFVSQNR